MIAKPYMPLVPITPLPLAVRSTSSARSWLRYTAPMRWIVIAFLILILASLGSALFYLVKDKGQGDRTLRALTLRVGLSVGLFVLLMLGYYFGLLKPGQ